MLILDVGFDSFQGSRGTSGRYNFQFRAWAMGCILAALLRKSTPDEFIQQHRAVRLLLRDYEDASFNLQDHCNIDQQDDDCIFIRTQGNYKLAAIGLPTTLLPMSFDVPRPISQLRCCLSDSYVLFT